MFMAIPNRKLHQQKGQSSAGQEAVMRDEKWRARSEREMKRGGRFHCNVNELLAIKVCKEETQHVPHTAEYTPVVHIPDLCALVFN
jgi:hypothetical protein